MRKLFDLAAADENIRFSPYCCRVKWALAHKNLDVKYLPWDFTEREKIYFSCKTLEEAIQDREKRLPHFQKLLSFLRKSLKLMGLKL